MEQPEGFVNPKYPNHVCKLKRSIYGLKQASRQWNKRFDDEIKKFGFTQNPDEPCVYIKASGSYIAILILYVDDILLMGNNIPMLQDVKSYLGRSFAMKDLGEAAYILGIKIYRDRSKRLIGLCQKAYIEKILTRFYMENSKRGTIPMQEKLKLRSIMYDVRCTCPDVAFAHNMTSRFQQNPGEEHWAAVKNILKYIRNTKDMFMVYGDAEYIDAFDASKEVVWIRKFIYGLGIVPIIEEPISMYCDNTRAIAIAKDDGVTKGARHFRAKVHYLRETIKLGDVKIEKIHTDDNLADPFTKALAFPKHSELTRNIGLLPARRDLAASRSCRMHKDRKTDYQDPSNREGKAKERKAKLKGKTEGKELLEINGKAIELGNLLERQHSQSLKHEKDRIDRSDSLKDNIISGLPPCSAITPNEPVLSTEEPNNSLSIGDEHLDTILAKSSVENLIPIPSESEGIPDHMCDVPFHDNSSPLDVLKDQSEDFSESNDEFSLTDDDSFSIDKIDYVEASPSDSELVSSEIKASNDNPIPFYDPIVSGNPLTLTPYEESDFFLEVDAFLAVEDEPTSSQFPKSYLDLEGDILLLEAFLNDDHSFDFNTKSSSTSLNSLLEETNNFDNSLPEFTNFSNVLFDAEYESDSSDDQSCSDEDVPEKIFSKPLFEEEIIPMKIDPHSDNVESDLMESLRTYDSSLLISSKIDSLLDEFAGELTLLKSIPPGINETDCDFEGDICLIENLFEDDEDNDSLMEEIDLFCTSNYPMSQGIEDDDYDSGRDILILKDLPRNNNLSFTEKESFHFDIPPFSRPPAKPPDEQSYLGCSSALFISPLINPSMGGIRSSSVT
nr:hypothetical protein [Tanacetum cinerariifolium]